MTNLNTNPKVLIGKKWIEKFVVPVPINPDPHAPTAYGCRASKCSRFTETQHNWEKGIDFVSFWSN